MFIDEQQKNVQPIMSVKAIAISINLMDVHLHFIFSEDNITEGGFLQRIEHTQ